MFTRRDQREIGKRETEESARGPKMKREREKKNSVSLNFSVTQW